MIQFDDAEKRLIENYRGLDDELRIFTRLFVYWQLEHHKDAMEIMRSVAQKIKFGEKMDTARTLANQQRRKERLLKERMERQARFERANETA